MVEYVDGAVTTLGHHVRRFPQTVVYAQSLGFIGKFPGPPQSVRSRGERTRTRDEPIRRLLRATAMG